ncbi:MAG: MoaD/ThiS family protein [Epsilonproteobacteria bacterium]|nr:MoaD/ThiS family protein [Campylobacterota bacterium]
MVKIEFLGPIKRDPIEMEVDNLKELAKRLNSDESLKEWLKSCAVAVNGKIVKSIEHPLKDGDVVSILPPVCGG